MDLFGLIRVQRIKKPSVPVPERLPGVLIGPGTYGEPAILGYGQGIKLEIGSFCSIADGVVILLNVDHRTDWVTTYPFSVLWSECRHLVGHPTSKGDVNIGHDVWLGYGATILSGVTIGTGAVIGCRAVVAQDIPPYAVAVGNPARVVRMRFTEGTISRLIASCWWALPRAHLLELMPLMLSNRVEEFLLALEAKPISDAIRSAQS